MFPPPLPATPRPKDPLAITTFLFGILSLPLAVFAGLLCWLGRDGGFGGPYLLGLLLLILGLLIHLVMTVLAVIAVTRERNFLTLAACGLNAAVLPLVLLLLMLALI